VAGKLGGKEIMTPEEKGIAIAKRILAGSPYMNHDELTAWLQDAFQESIAEAIVADRSQLQSEIVKRLQLEREGDLPNTRLALNAAIGIVQAVMCQKSPPAESRPENETLWRIAQSFCGAFCVTNGEDSPDLEAAIKSRIDWLERRVTELEQECGQILRESNRHVLAEREACAETAREYAHEFRHCGNEAQTAHFSAGLHIMDRIRFRAINDPGYNQPAEQGSEMEKENAKSSMGFLSVKNGLINIASGEFQSDRIRQLHETIGEQAEKIRLLEKEKNELIQSARNHISPSYDCGMPSCILCEGAIGRKA
jgi:hypothetical protein